MLREVAGVQQVPGRPRRRWFEDDQFDLVVWTADSGAIVGVQLCYDKGTPTERAVTWLKDRELSHRRVDDGEDRAGRFKMSPILVPDGACDSAALLRAFAAASRDLDPAIVRAVSEAITRLDQGRRR